MTADIINLKRARKQKARAEKDQTAKANRILHGTPKTLHKIARARADQAMDRLDDKRLDRPPE